MHETNAGECNRLSKRRLLPFVQFTAEINHERGDWEFCKNVTDFVAVAVRRTHRFLVRGLQLKAGVRFDGQNVWLASR